MRRLKRFLIAPQLLGEMFINNGTFKIKSDFPKDIKVIGVNIDRERYAFSIVIESKKFKEVDEGSIIPEIEPPIVIITKEEK